MSAKAIHRHDKALHRTRKHFAMRHKAAARFARSPLGAASVYGLFVLVAVLMLARGLGY